MTGSIVANTIIYRLVPSPPWFEIRQCMTDGDRSSCKDEGKTYFLLID